MEEKNYGATDDEANTPLMEDHGLLTEKPVRRGRAVATAAVVGTTLFMAAVGHDGPAEDRRPPRLAAHAARHAERGLGL